MKNPVQISFSLASILLNINPAEIPHLRTGAVFYFTDLQQSSTDLSLTALTDIW